MVSIMFASCSNDELKEIYQGEEIAFTTQVGRSIETSLGTLDGFYVYADAPGASMFINGDVAEKENGSKYTFKNSYFWPQGIEKMEFWAYGPKEIIDSKNVHITAQSQILQNFTPANEPENQKDLVVAYANVDNKLEGMSVPLTFHHALSQIVIKAKCPSNNKRVYVKGVWMVNVNGSGTLEFKQDVTNHMSWLTTGSATHYGKEFDKGSGRYVLLTSSSTELTPLLENGTTLKNSLMLVPQESDGLAFDKDGKVTTQGTYILLLCRVEAEHQGEYHADGSTGVEGGGLILSSNGKHIHQLFPIVGDAFDETQYGYTCVPVDITWQPGKKYVYNLEFCGHSSGAGIYPPAELPEGLPDGVKVPPTGKNPGQPVLDYPISFNVTVDDWSTNDKGEDITENEDVSMN